MQVNGPDASEQERRRLAARVAELEALVYVPGLWSCPKCKFQLMQANLHAHSGNVSSRDAPGDKCPNCNSPLWRVTERQAGNDMVDRCAEALEREKALIAKGNEVFADLAERFPVAFSAINKAWANVLNAVK